MHTSKKILKKMKETSISRIVLTSFATVFFLHMSFFYVNTDCWQFISQLSGIYNEYTYNKTYRNDAFVMYSKAHAFPQSKADLEEMAETLANTGLTPGDLPPLNNPNFIDIGAASMSFDDTDIFFVVPVGTMKPLKERDVILIPQKILVWHEVLNMMNRDMSLAITYSPVSGSLAVYNSRTKDYFLQLFFQGSVYDGNSVLMDSNTNSLWSQLYGLSFFGTLAGTGLEIMPCYWTNWYNIRRFYEGRDNAKVLSTPRGGRRYGKDPYGSYLHEESFYFNNSLIYPVKKVDVRLDLKAQVIGIEMDKKFIAVEVNYVKEKECVNFFFNSHPLVAIYDERLGVVRIFERSVWDGKDPLIFKMEQGVLRDFHTKSAWSNDGVCEFGNYTGAYLKEVFGIYSFWYAWASMNPETEIVPGDSVVPDSALEVGISLDNQLSKGLEGNIYESDMNRPWNSLNSPSQSNYSDRQVTEKTPWENGNRPEYTPLDKQ